MTQPQPTDADGYLPQSLKQLNNAISALADPKPILTKDPDNNPHNATTHWVDPLYQQLAEDIPRQTTTEGHGTAKSVPPIQIESADLLHEIDNEIRKWHPKLDIYDGDLTLQYPPTPDTIRRLYLIEKHKWRPQDCQTIDHMTGQLERWANRIREILTPTPKLSLPSPCPACGADVVYRRDSTGDLVRGPALTVDAVEGCKCLKCHHVWGPQYFLHLINVLGYKLPEGVLE